MLDRGADVATHFLPQPPGIDWRHQACSFPAYADTLLSPCKLLRLLYLLQSCIRPRHGGKPTGGSADEDIVTRSSGLGQEYPSPTALRNTHLLPHLQREHDRGPDNRRAGAWAQDPGLL